MSTVVVAGGSIAGLATALALARAGHSVVVLERAAPPPEGPLDEAVRRWSRPLVPQSRHSHTLTSVGVRTLREQAPDVYASLCEAGAQELDLVVAAPHGGAGGAREAGDDELVALGCRRAALELLLYRAVRAQPGVRIRHGTKVDGLLLDASRSRAAGLRTEHGEKVPADLVVDATGRRGASLAWLTELGVTVPQDLTAPSGLRGFSRFYRLRRSGHRPGPLNRGNAAGIVGDHYAAVLHPGDNDTFSIALGVLPEDRDMRALRHPAAFTAVARCTPAVGAWLADEVADPISPVAAITMPPSRLCGLAVCARPPVTGLFLVGDSACVTNPLWGRGMSLALAHAFRLAELLAARPRAGLDQAREAARIAEQLYTPWHRQAADDDRERIARWRAVSSGTEPPAAPSRTADGLTLRTVGRAAGDPAVWRGLTRVLMGLQPPSVVFDDERFRTRVHRALGAAVPAPAAAPTRADLTRAVAATEGR